MPRTTPLTMKEVSDARRRRNPKEERTRRAKAEEMPAEMPPDRQSDLRLHSAGLGQGWLCSFVQPIHRPLHGRLFELEEDLCIESMEILSLCLGSRVMEEVKGHCSS